MHSIINTGVKNPKMATAQSRQLKGRKISSIIKNSGKQTIPDTVSMEDILNQKAEIKRMRVNPDYQGKGYGQIMLRELQDMLKF